MHDRAVIMALPQSSASDFSDREAATRLSGGPIAAGTAIGSVSAATAAAWAGAPLQPGYCWHYTDASRTQGFWDACP
jgi:hypothetical protein